MYTITQTQPFTRPRWDANRPMGTLHSRHVERADRCGAPDGTGASLCHRAPHPGRPQAHWWWGTTAPDNRDHHEAAIV